MAVEAPQWFGDYELLRRLGIGGMAEAFLAVRRGPDGFEQRVCLKRILATFQDDPEFVEMFLREARLSAMLYHGNVARVLDFGVIDGAHYLTLELIEGSDLREVLAYLRAHGRNLGHELTTYVAHALASALDFAHTADDDGRAAGIVHRDISPSNVLVSDAGEIKLADFGIAKEAGLAGSVQSTALKGKIPYMAPEYAMGRHSDARTDLFSLGVLLYECLVGHRPFDGENDLETLDRARHGERESLRSTAPDAPPSLVFAIENLLAPEARDRTPNAGRLLDQLDDVPPGPRADRRLAHLVQEVTTRRPRRDAPGLAATRPAPTLAARTRAAPTRK